MKSKALALGKQVKAEALNSNVHLLSVTLRKRLYPPYIISLYFNYLNSYV
jgi:hypothetical protein